MLNECIGYEIGGHLCSEIYEPLYVICPGRVGTFTITETVSCVSTEVSILPHFSI